ncbi:MAG: DnaJ domain-containing protein [Myxococcota bacterium]
MLKRRFINMARAEATHAAFRLRAAARGLYDAARSNPPSEKWADEELSRIRAEVEAEMASGVAATPADTPEIRRFYANLELPLGASAAEVKAAYRRLMRRYHPDKHSGDPDRARAAHLLAHELRRAYEGLLKHLRR